MKLTGESYENCAFDELFQLNFYNLCLKEIPFNGIESMETALCDFNSLANGRYYVGHDIDQMQEQAIIAQFQSDHWLWKARKMCLDNRYLGELCGRHLVDKQRKSIFKETGQVLTRQ
jgi:hypothetical protein